MLHLPMAGRWVPEPELVLAPLRCWQPCLRVAGHMAYPPTTGMLAQRCLLHPDLARPSLRDPSRPGLRHPAPWPGPASKENPPTAAELALAPLRCWQPCLRVAGHMAYPQTTGMLAQRCLLHLPMAGHPDLARQGTAGRPSLRGPSRPSLRPPAPSPGPASKENPPTAGMLAQRCLLHWMPEPELGLAPLCCWQTRNCSRQG